MVAVKKVVKQSEAVAFPDIVPAHLAETFNQSVSSTV